MKLFLTIFFITFASITSAEVDQEKIKSVMRNAIKFGVNEELHGTLWNSLTNSEEYEINAALDFLSTAQEWQYAFWDSAYKTAQTRKVIRTADYNKLFTKLSPMPEQQRNLIKSEDILNKIAVGKPIELPYQIGQMIGETGNQIILNEEITSFIRDNVGLAADRLRILVSPNWPPIQKEYIYKKQGLRYVSNERLVFRQFDTELFGVSGWEVVQTLGTDATLELVVYKYDNANYEMLDHDTVMENFIQMGIPNSYYSKGTWHGAPYKTSMIQYEVGNQKIYGASTTITDQRRLITYNFIVNSFKNNLDALSKFNMLLTKLSPL